MMETLYRPPESETHETRETNESQDTRSKPLLPGGRSRIQQGEAPDSPEHEPERERIANTGYVPKDQPQQPATPSDQPQQPGQPSDQPQQPPPPSENQPPPDQAQPPAEEPLLVRPTGIEKFEGKRNPWEDELVERPGARNYPDEPKEEGEKLKFR